MRKCIIKKGVLLSKFEISAWDWSFSIATLKQRNTCLTDEEC